MSEHYGDCVPGGALRIGTDDVTALNGELLQKHYKYARPGVEATPWDTREMSIKDPFGNRLVFSEPVARPAGQAGPSMTPLGATSRWVAANRALETESTDPLYRDRFARELAGIDGPAMMSAMRTSMGLMPSSDPDPYLPIRTKFLDDALLRVLRSSNRAGRSRRPLAGRARRRRLRRRTSDGVPDRGVIDVSR